MSSSLPPVTPPVLPHDSSAELPVVGQCWQRVYQVESATLDPDGQRMWSARRHDTDEPVTILARHCTDPVRDRVWTMLHSLQLPTLQHTHEAHQTGSLRVEVYAAAPTLSLRDWRRTQPTLDPAMVQTLVPALAEAIHALHQHGIVHLNIRPDTIFLVGPPGSLHPVLAGLDRATLVAQPGLIPIEVDPFYAPPEAAGLSRHAPGETLNAWDWWSLGRVLQELILGQHVLGLLLDRDVATARFELHEAAESLLLEQTAGGDRAGAVEAMPALPARLQQLLRGLLTSARDGRWCYADLVEWLRGETVREHYQLSRQERLFRYQGRAYTLAEAGDVLRSAAHWPQAQGQVYDAQTPGTLAHFLHTAPGMEHHRDRWLATLALADDETLRNFPRPLVQELTAALALLQLAGNRLIWRGHPVDRDWLRDWLQREDFDLQWLHLLSTPAVLCPLQPLDATAARLLEETAHLATTALTHARHSGWLLADDPAGVTEFWLHALAPETAWRQSWKTLQQRFAHSDQPELDHLLHTAHPSPPELVLLFWAAHHADRCGWITHAAWARQQYEALCTRGAALAAQLFWRRLHTVLRASPWWFGRFRWLLAGWGGVALLLVLAKPGPFGLLLALVPVLVAGGARLGLHLIVAPLARQYAPTSAPWRWRDGPARCQRELAQFAVPRSAAETTHELRNLNTEIELLTELTPTPASLPIPPRLLELWIGALGSWLLLLGLVALGSWQLRLHAPSWPAFRQAWNPPPSATVPIPSASGQPRQASSEKSTDPTAHVKISWPHRVPLDLALAPVKAITPATPEQLAAARRAGQKLVADYLPETITAPIAVAVPNGSDVGLMLYDGRRGQPVGKSVYHLHQLPRQRSWLLIDSQPAIFLLE